MKRLSARFSNFRKALSKWGVRAVAAVVVVALLVGPQVYLTQHIGQMLQDQASALSSAVASTALQTIDILKQEPSQTVRTPAGTKVASLLEQVAEATVKIEVKLKYEVVKVTYDSNNRPSLQDLADGKFWNYKSFTSSIRWLRFLGSGFVIYSGEDQTFEYNYRRAPQTLILTNYHIIEQQDRVFQWQLVLGKDAQGNTTFDVVEAWRLIEIEIVGFFGGDESVGIPLKTIGNLRYRNDAAASPTLDLAVLETARPVGGLPALKKWAAAKALSLGQPMYLVGYPLGNPGPAVAQGIVSVTKQNLGGSAEGWDSDLVWNNLFQYDAAQTPGNSGSVILNHQGEILGIARGSSVQIVQVLQPEPENPLWYEPGTGRPLPPILPPWLRTHDKPTDKLQWVDVVIPYEGVHYGVRGEAVMKWLRLMGFGFVLEQKDEVK